RFQASMENFETTHVEESKLSVTFCSNVLKVCTKNGFFLEGKQVHSYIIKSGFDYQQSLLNQLLNLYLKCRDFEDGVNLFDEMSIRNVVSWNIMISGCGYNMAFDGNQSLLLFKRMLFDKVEPNYITFVSLLSSCIEFYDVGSGKQLHCFITKYSFSNNHVVCSVLIDLYGKCGLVEEARRLFDRTLPKDLVLWNVMVSCYTLNSLGEEALGVFELLRSDGLKGDDFTFSSLLCSCGIIGFGDLGKQIHGLIIRLSFDMDILVSSALIDMYVKNDNILDARKIFDGMTTRNVVSWTTMVVGYGRQGDGKEAMQLLKDMLRGYLSPDELTIASILSSCANIAAINEIGQVHSHATKKGLESFLSIGNALINAYSKCGSLAGAFQSFNSICKPNLITWTSIIGAYAFHGLPRRAIEIFEEMLSKGAEPDRLAFLGVLSACSHGGLVSEGFYYFGSMTNDHQLVPGLEHYACLIDLLGRAGHLDRAYDILENMPIEPGANVLGAFIGACKAHGNVRLAILAAEKLFKLEPEDSMSYTLMSNSYAFVGRWIDVARVRKLMRDRCDHKVPGCSWIEIGAKVHTFVSSDKSHPQATELYNMLELFASPGEGLSIQRRVSGLDSGNIVYYLNEFPSSLYHQQHFQRYHIIYTRK
ncbi:hypothetical protein AQUCO_01300258v1, partial [Aquilegia coerulea]